MTNINRLKRLEEAFDYLVVSEIVGTQKDVAARMKVQRSTVNSALNGKEEYLTDSFLKKFARTFNLSALYLIKGEGSLLGDAKINSVAVAENSGTINNGSTVTNTYTKDRKSNSAELEAMRAEHDELIKLRTEMNSIKRVIENVFDANTAISVVASILGANIKDND